MNSKDKNINKNQQKGGYYLEGFVAFIVLIIITFLTGYLYEFDINNVTQMFYTKLEEENEANRIKQIKDSKNTEQSVSTNIEYKIPSRSQDPTDKKEQNNFMVLNTNTNTNKNDLLLSLLIESSKKVVKRKSTKEYHPSESSSNKNDLLFSLLIESSKKVVNSASTEKVVTIYSSFKDNLSKKILDCDDSDDLSKSLWTIMQNKFLADSNDYKEHLKSINNMWLKDWLKDYTPKLTEKETKIKDFQTKYKNILKEIKYKRKNPIENLSKIEEIERSIEDTCENRKKKGFKNDRNLINDLFDDSIIIEYLRGFECIREGIESFEDKYILNTFDSFVKSVNKLELRDFLEGDFLEGDFLKGDLLKNTSLLFQSKSYKKKSIYKSNSYKKKKMIAAKK